VKTALLILAVCGAVVVAACGQKGALYLPDKNAAVVTRPAGANNPASTAPAPAQPQQPQDKDKSDDDSKPK
jgi:predicted small lipoprotein YifL